MAVFKCKICGGSLDIADGNSVAVCDYCGTKQTVSTTKDDVVANLFNRANNLRLKCEFDKAEQVYEKILDIDNTDAEAHWGMVLCKYGIEYVEDKKTDSKIPTCHRTLYEAILTDVDYLATIENADASQKELYEAEAKVIDELQKNILNIVSNEEPFDVFICYKETDDDGKRTVDSSISNDIYYQLTQEGFKVFYAPITLEDKLGYEYEPYIFAALNSAKVMLVIGTKPEHFDAVWVRNEWSRYLKIMKTDRSKLLIPCYKDMDAYELPDEFAHLQAQDMGKIGFISDVIRGLRKALNRDNVVQPTISKKVKVKKNKKFKEVLDKYKKKWQEKKKYCLNFPLKIFSRIFNIFGIVFWLLSVLKLCLSLEYIDDALVISLWFSFGILIPVLASVKVIKNKILAVLLQGSMVIFNIFLCSYPLYFIKRGAYIFAILSTLLSLVWFILICFSKKVEKATLKKYSRSKTVIPAIILSVLLIAVMELGGTDFCNYQLAKGFYKIGEYECAYGGFTYLGDYKDSKNLAKKSNLAKIKNADLYDRVNLGDWNSQNYICSGKNSDWWYVISKENNKVLLLSTASSSVLYSSDCNIIGGWKNSSLREFLNSTYVDITFDDYAKEQILTTQLVNSSDITDVTEDKIFILSENEILQYFPFASDRTRCVMDTTMRNVENGIYTVICENNFEEVEYVDDEIIFKKEFGNSTSERAEKYLYKSKLDGAFNGVYFPAMWIDISDIDN